MGSWAGVGACLVALVVCACARSGSDAAVAVPGASNDPSGHVSATPTTGATPSAPAVATSAAPPESGAPLPTALLNAVCNHAPCGGESALVQVFRDSGGRVGRLYRIYGGCVHSPGIYFTPDGKESAVIPERPIRPGSAEAIAIQGQHAAQTAGLTHTESVRCADGARVPPR